MDRDRGTWEPELETTDYADYADGTDGSGLRMKEPPAPGGALDPSAGGGDPPQPFRERLQLASAPAHYVFDDFSRRTSRQP